MKYKILILTIVFGFFTMEIARVSLGWAILFGSICFLLLIWLSREPHVDKVHRKAEESSREQETLINKKGK